jgi:hypothetical protein
MSIILNGNTGITFPNSTVQSNAGVAQAQTWVAGLANTTRFFNTTYTNFGNKPMTVYVVCNSAGAGYDPQMIINGVNTGRFGGATNANAYNQATFFVPAGGTYNLTASSCALSYWSELT